MVLSPVPRQRGVLLQAALGGHRLLARAGDRRLCVLDAPAAALWDLRQGGCRGGELADLLAKGFGLSPAGRHRSPDPSLILSATQSAVMEVPCAP